MQSRLLETICIKDGVIQNISYHNQRLNSSRKLLFSNLESIDLLDFIKIPDEFKQGVIRCRVLYQNEIEEIQFLKYNYRKIETLKVVDAQIDYAFKWENRQEINQLVAANPTFDDILMVKDGFITDTSYANIVFKKDNEFFTPKKPLLNGTKRQHLIDEEILIEKNIKPSDLKKYSHFALINAFNDFDLSKFIPINNITYSKKSKKI